MALKDRFGSMGLFAVRDNNEIINLAEHFLELNSDAGAILTTTPLGDGASYTQAGQDRLNRSPVVNRVKGEVWADQAGTLYLEESENNSTWTATMTVAVSAGVTAQIPWTILTKRYFRFRYVNGATAQTGFILVQQTGGPGMRNTVLTGSTVTDAGSLPDFVIPVAGYDGSKIRLFKTAPDRRLEIWLNRLDFLTADHDSIAIGAMAKGDLSIPFDSVTSGGTSREILCAGFNALLLHHVITGAPATGGYATITMSPKSGGTFVAHHGDGQNIQTAAVTASYISLFRGILDYVKVVLNVTDGTHTVIVQPLNI